MKLIAIFSLVFAGLISFNPADAVAQSAADTQEDTLTYILESVVVCAERFQSTLVITEITANRIRAANASNVADVLRNEKGIIATSGPKSECDTKIRGFPASSVLVLVDGHPINPGYYGKVDLSMLPVDNIAKIEVIKGPATAAYGANGMGGVINIITKNGLEIPQTAVESEFGDTRYRKVAINHSRQVGKTNFWVSGYENNAQGFRLSDKFRPTPLENGGTRESNSYHKAGFDGKIGFSPSTQSLLSLSLGYHWARKDVAPTIYTWDGPSYREFPDWRRSSVALSGYWRVRPSIELKTILFADAYADRFVSFLNSAKRYDQIEYDSKLENWTTGFTADARMTPTGNQTLHAGITFKRDLMNKKPDLDEPWFSRRTYTGSVFLEDAFCPVSSSEITVGLGYHYFGLQGSATSTSILCPMISLNQQLPFRFRSQVGYARAVRFPNIHQLFGETSGNESLAPEQADKYEIGLTRRFFLRRSQDYASFELVLFHNDLKNLIYRESRSYRFKNIGRAKLQGWEATVEWTLMRVLEGELSYSHVQEPDPEKQLLEEVPENTWRLSLFLKTGFGAELNYRYSHSDQRSTYRSDFVLPAYNVHDFNVTQKLTNFMRLRFQISNITDTNYEEELGYPAPGRQLAIGLTFSM